MMPHNPLGPICTAASVHFGAAVPNFAWLECRVLARRTGRVRFRGDVPKAGEARRHQLHRAGWTGARRRGRREGRCRGDLPLLGGAAPPPRGWLLHQLVVTGSLCRLSTVLPSFKPISSPGATISIEHPELLYDVHRTAADGGRHACATFGVDEVTTGIGRTGVVGVIRGRKTDSGKVIGLRADMDALPIAEKTGRPYASTVPGMMHACGHDGHTAMLLGAARYLAETRNFDGTAIVIFQPAEEGGGGGKAMIEDGLMERWAIQEVYGMHNLPGLPVGTFAMRPGPIMASTDEFTITITGRDGHAARPHTTVDPIVVGAGAGQGAADHRLAQCRSARCRRRLGDPLPRRHRLQRHPRDRRGRRHRALSLAAPGPRPRREAHRRDHQRHRRGARRQRQPRTTTATIRSPATTRAQSTSPPASPARSSAPPNVATDAPPLLAGEDFAYMLEAAPGRLSSSSAMATAPGCTTPATISTTRSSRSAAPTGRGWSRRRCRPETPDFRGRIRPHAST